MDKATVLFISGRMKDREEFKEKLFLNESYLIRDDTYRNLSNYSARKIIRKIQSFDNIFTMNIPIVMIFENINSNVINNIGDELNNMIIDIHLNKFDKCVKDKQIVECLELLEKL